jgi:hypothetical protein
LCVFTRCLYLLLLPSPPYSDPMASRRRICIGNSQLADSPYAHIDVVRFQLIVLSCSRTAKSSIDGWKWTCLMQPCSQEFDLWMEVTCLMHPSTSSGLSHPPHAYTVQPMVGSIDGLDLPHAPSRTTHEHECFFLFSI